MVPEVYVAFGHCKKEPESSSTQQASKLHYLEQSSLNILVFVVVHFLCGRLANFWYL